MNIYEQNEINFENNGLGFLTDVINARVEDNLNGDYSLFFEYKLDGNLSEYLQNENIIKCKVADGSKQLFVIKNIVKTFNSIQVVCKHIFYQLLDNFVEDTAPTNLSPQQFLTWILDRTNYQNNFKVYSDITTTKSARYVRKNPVEIILGAEDNSMISLFGGELKRDNFDIRFNKAIGNDNGVRLMVGKNITGINISIDTSSVHTRIMPQGYDGLFLPDKYVDSPLIDNYLYPKIYKVEFSDIKYDPNDENAYHTLDEAYTALRNAVNELYDSGIDKPVINVRTDWRELSKTNEYKNYSNLERVSLGDTITVNLLNITYKSKVIKTTYNVLTDKIESFEVGSPKANIGTSTNNINKKIEKINPTSILKAAKDDATKMLTQALGGYVVKTQNEILIMDTDDVNTATKVWRWNMNGLGYSESGIDGPYSTAITADGKIVADFITTGKLDTSVIEGYGSLILTVGSLEENVSALDTKINGVSADFEDFKDNEYVQSISNLQDQIDGAIQFWNGADIPTLNNYPANEWTTENDKINHQADIYTVIQDVEGEMKQGKSYRFDKINGVWQWVELTDNELSAVQKLAQDALNKANQNEKDIATTKTQIEQTDKSITLLSESVEQLELDTTTSKKAIGNPIEIEDAGNYPLESIGIEGKSEQETRSGKNLWKLPKTQTLNGVTLTNNGDGTITLNGTATANADFYAEDNSSNYTNGEKYYISSNINKSDVTLLIANYNGNTYANTMINSNQTMPFTMNTTNDKVRLIVRVLSGKTFNNTKLQIQLEKGSTATDFEPYGASPSPDYPSEIKTVKGIRNLFDKEQSNYFYYQRSLDNNGNITNSAYRSTIFKYPIPNDKTISLSIEKGYIGNIFLYAKDGTFIELIKGNWDKTKTFVSTNAYFVSFAMKSDTDTAILYDDFKQNYNLQIEEDSIAHPFVPYGNWLVEKITGKNLLSELEVGNINSSGVPYNDTTSIRSKNFDEVKPNTNYTVSKNGVALGINVSEYDKNQTFIKRTYYNTGTFVTSSTTKYVKVQYIGTLTNDIQLEEGSQPTEYEPYKENTALIDMNIYDEEGNIVGYHELASIEDTKDTFKDGILTQRIGKVVLDGSENITSNPNGTNSYNVDIGKLYKRNPNLVTLMCSHFKAVSYNNRALNENNICYLDNNGTTYQLTFRNTTFTTLETLKTWLSNNPVEVYYILETPIEHTLDYEILELHKGYNNITLNDELNPSMNIKYLTDSKLNAEYTTKSEFNISNNSIRESVSAEIKELDKKTEASLELKVDEKDMMSQINAKADEINFESDKMIIKSSDFELKNGKIKATGGTIGEWKLDGKGNLYSDYGNYRIYLQNAKVAGGDTWVLSSQIKNSAGNYNGAFILYANGDIESYKRIISHNSIFSDGNIVCGQIEVCNPFPYIDFHWNTTPNNYTDDYSTRIIEREYGVISFLNASGWANCRGGSWTNSSSRLVKKNIEEISEDEAKALLDLKAVSFDYKNGVTNNQRGFIAEDVLEVMKDYVYVPENYDETKFDNTEDENGNIDITQDVPSLDYSKFVVPLVKLCQMQQKQIDELLERLEKLENEVSK